MSLFSNLIKGAGVLGGFIVGGPAGAAIAGAGMGAGSGIDKKNAQENSRKAQAMSQGANALRGGQIQFQPTEDSNIFADAVSGGITGAALQKAGLFGKLLGSSDPGAVTAQGEGLSGLSEDLSPKSISISQPFEVSQGDRKSTRLNSSHVSESRMPSSA